MRIWGVPSIVDKNYLSDTRFLDVFNWPDIVVDSMYHGVDWVYSYVEAFTAYDFRLWYFWLFNSIFSDNIDLFFKSYWFVSFDLSGLQLFWSVILDQYLYSLVSKLPYDEYWFKSLLSSQETTLMLIHHPEIEIIKLGFKNSLLFPYLSDFIFPLYNLVDFESVLLPVMLFPQFVLTIYVFGLIIIFYFSFFTSSTKEENLIDNDYMLTSAAIESEEEISSFDDIIIAAIMIIYIFGWFFYFQSGMLLNYGTEILMVLYLMPGLYYVIFCIPTFLAYDFGIFFLGYLRGVGPSPVLILELLYDYIAIFSFYIRLCVQGVRLILMLFTFASLHDYIVFFTVNPKFFIGRDTLWDDIKNLSLTYESFTYFFFSKIPGRLAYWVYELFHTFFVVVAQFIAFFAMVFWLFFFYIHFLFLKNLKLIFKKDENLEVIF